MVEYKIHEYKLEFYIKYQFKLKLIISKLNFIGLSVVNINREFFLNIKCCEYIFY